VRLILNVTYARLVEGLDSKQRREFDDKLYGFDVTNREATRAMMSDG
jgi:hypothetical protein